ncbi:MAG: c-type cytochrome [Planctomycetota bacterium]|nr:c-type cytochrome [Planctomycetota bacterium]
MGPLTLCTLSVLLLQGEEAPRSKDSRLTMDLFAEHPQIVTPTGITVDNKGRVFVAESHTHFRPRGYDGPPADRILIFEDETGNGRAETPSVFHEGFKHIMDIEFRHDGSLYVATRMDIHRLEDTVGDSKADKITPVVNMETTGTYPHNGLSGLAFDFRGNLNFGLGENLGHAYTLVGTDGTRISGGGEGGSTYHVRHDGTKLRRTSTGWWNPFGMCVDAFGRVFGTDNDPGASPPCRLIQVIEGGDYGYEYRYGRSGLHPLVTWTGDIPGTLPMIAGTGEAPCAVIAYESDGLPQEYLGHLLVASWADHRIEYYRIEQPVDAGLVNATRATLFEGSNEFRPVGLAIAPDGSVYVSDWVSSSYKLHRKGRVWRIRSKGSKDVVRSTSTEKALFSRHRASRESASRKLSGTAEGREFLRGQMLKHEDPRVRAAAMHALIASGTADEKLHDIARQDAYLPNRVIALNQNLGNQPTWTKTSSTVPILAASLTVESTESQISAALNHGDPLLHHVAVAAITEGNVSRAFAQAHPLAVLLAEKRKSSHAPPLTTVEGYLGSADPDVRFTMIKWIADTKAVQFRARIQKLVEAPNPNIDLRTYRAAIAALDYLDGKKPSDRPSPAFLVSKLTAAESPAPLLRLVLRLIDPNHKALKTERLTRFLKHPEVGVRIEAIRTLSDRSGAGIPDVLAKVAADEKQSDAVRAEAVAGLAAAADKYADTLIQLAMNQSDELRDEALRSLTGIRLEAAQKEKLAKLSGRRIAAKEAVNRLQGALPSRPQPDQTDAWLAVVTSGKGNPSAGERIFMGTKVGTCSLCHQYEGRGRAVGPDLSRLHRRLSSSGKDGQRWLLESILQPSKEIPPQFTPWQVITNDGKTLIGLPRRKGGNAEAYLGLDGREFSVRKPNIKSHREMSTSIMPEGLLNNLTTQELRDLFAFLMKR